MGIDLVDRLNKRSSAIKPKTLLISIIPTVIIALDQWTKHAILERFRLGESVPVLEGFFSLTYIRNPGAAFGLLAQAHPAFRVPFFLIIPIVALVVIGMVFKKLPDNSLRVSSALGLVIGGAVGNLIDRVRFGYVVDFLDFHWQYTYHFPAFNVADSAICVGVTLLILDILFQPEAKSEAGNASTTS